MNDRDAHAWVEVYFPGYGWLPFEPTPGAHLPTDRRPRTRSSRRRQTTAAGTGRAPGAPQALVTAQSVRRKQRPRGRERRALGSQRQGHGARASSGDARHGRQRRRTAASSPWLLTRRSVLVALLAAVKFAARALALPAPRPAGAGLGGLPRPGHVRRRPGHRAAPERHVRGARRALQRDVRRRRRRRSPSSASRARYAPLPGPSARPARCAASCAAIKRGVRASCSTPRERVTGALRLRSALAQTTLG